MVIEEKLATKQDLHDLEERVSKKFEKVDEKFDQVNMRFSNVEHKIDSLTIRLDNEIQKLSLHLTIRLGGLTVIRIMVLAALIKF